MIVFIEPISNNIGMYVPAYPLPLMEVAGFIKANEPKIDLRVISIPMDYGLPLTKTAKDRVYMELFQDLSRLKPSALGISCTAISQAEETVDLCRRIKDHDPDIFIFLGGYFPTIYHEEIFSKTSSVDLIVVGEGEIPALEIARAVEKGENPKKESIPNLVWRENGNLHYTQKGIRFDLKEKAFSNLSLLKFPDAYDILPYAFSRGCPYRCNFCMEDYIRPQRREVPQEIVLKDLEHLLELGNSNTLLIADALFRSFDLFPYLRSLGIKINFETRCDVLDPKIIPDIADVCGVMALGLESASYSTLRRMNKVKNRSHYERYISNAEAIFKTAAENNLPMMVFMIAGYPGDTVEDLETSLAFAKKLAAYTGPGGHVFKIGECHVYPKTKIYDLATSLDDVQFDDDGVFGQNVVRQPSANLSFDRVLDYANDIFSLSNQTPKLREALLNVMPFFRLPVTALQDELIPDGCFMNGDREILSVRKESIIRFRHTLPKLAEKYKKSFSGERSGRRLSL
jgi:radical SAM superfamily enzyme YgiQ (UPF0313 family)